MLVLLIVSSNNPNHIVNNLTGDTLTPEEERVLKFGLNHGLATRLTESDVVASAESIWDQLQRNDLLPDGYLKRQKIKNSIKALACNFLDFEDRKMSEDAKHIKILKNLREKYAILKPDKGNGVVLIKKDDYVQCLSALFSDTTKFRKLKHDPTLAQLNSLQRYLRTINKRNEIDDSTYEHVRPQSTRPARAHGLPKTHKSFDVLPPFRPIVDTTGTAYQPLAKYLSALLSPLTQNEFSLKDSFDAVTRIHNIPPHLFAQGYRFVSFDVKSLFTNIPLKKVIKIILKRVYDDKEITTKLKPRTLKKLLKDCCMKTPFSFNNELYHQIDGVSMGSPLGPTLANILMTALEDDIIRPLITSDTLKFYVRYVDDTLVLAKPDDIPLILDKLNSFHPQIQFTYEEFVDHNDVHFLDIKLDPQGTTIYRKSTHTGQYRHFSSFTPWSRKVAWIRALVQRAIKICSTQQLLHLEIQNIKQFASWNGFPRWLSDKLIHSFTSQTPKPTRDNNDPVHTIWIKLPFIGKKGNFLIRNCTRKISRLLKRPVKFVNHWDVVESNTFTSQKDPTPKPYKSSVVYKFVCPGCNASYIGKTDRCLYTRINEHAKSDKSEIYNHVHACEHFQHVLSLLNLPSNLLDVNYTISVIDLIFNNCYIIDRSNNWSLLLFKEAYHIRRCDPPLNHGARASKELTIFR